MSHTDNKTPRFLRLPEVKRQVGLGRSAIYDAISKSNFPAPIKVGKRAVAWLSTDIDSWIEGRVAATKAAV